MLPYKFKFIGLFIALISITVIVGRLVYFATRPPIVHTTQTKSSDTTAKYISDSAEGALGHDTIPRYEYYRSIVRTIDANGKIIKTVTKVKSAKSAYDDPAIFSFNLLLIAGFLMIILSREKIEDERIDKIRLVAFRLSFIAAISAGIVLLVFEHYSIPIPVNALIMAMLAGYFSVYYFLKMREAAVNKFGA